MTRKTKIVREKSVSVPLSTTKIMGIGLKLNLGLHGETLPVNCLSHGMANTFIYSGARSIEDTIGVFTVASNENLSLSVGVVNVKV
jgi:hypothetical protein